MPQKKNSAPPVLLIDGDVYAYQAAAAAETTVSFDGVNYTRIGNLPDAIVIFEDKLQAILSRFKTDRYVIAFTDGEHFRKEILPTYKGNRDPRDKPLALSALKDHIRKEHRTYQRPHLEADDILGILATSTRILPEWEPCRKIIVSVDKDMRTIPGEFWHSKEGKLYKTSEEEAAYRHMLQTLTGDVTDGYRGCPNIGPVFAGRILDGLTGYAQMWPAVVEAFEKKGLTEDDALVQARMARILRVTDYDFKKKEVKLWEPPKKI